MIFGKNKDKKGNMILDGLLLVIGLVVFGIFLVYITQGLTDINTDIQADEDMSAEAKASLQAHTTNFPIIFNNIFLMFLILLWVAAIVSSIYIDSRPEFFIISILLLTIILWIGGEMSNAYFDVADDPDFAATSAKYTFLNWVFNHYITVILVIIISIGIALFAKSQSGGNF